MENFLVIVCLSWVMFLLYMVVAIPNDNNDILIELRDSSCISEEKRND